MTTTLTDNEQDLKELDYRESDGIEVSLTWSRADGSLAVAVRDARAGEQFDFPVKPEQAWDAFQHPFAYAAPAVPFPSRPPTFSRRP
jgi:hypothetical protein